jgi:hypothetical protein
MGAWTDDEHMMARMEYAHVLRGRGMKLAEIGRALGLGKQRAQHLVVFWGWYLEGYDEWPGPSKPKCMPERVFRL